MIKLKVLLTALSLLVTSAVFAHGDEPHSHESREKVAWQQIKQGAIIVDTRTAKEFSEGHLKDAINIPFDVAVEQFLARGISKDSQIVLYCRSGNRAGKALKALKKAGYTKLHNGGGFNGMMAAK